MSDIDPFRANRELERWLFNGAVEIQFRPRGLPADWKDRATRIGTIIYDFENEEVRYEMASDAQTTETRVVHVNDRVKGAVYIGRRHKGSGLRSSPFANPFRVEEYTRLDAIAYYRTWLEVQLRRRGSELIDQLIALRGKPLACWCRHDGEERTAENACHGDVLIELLERYSDEELRAMGGTR